MMVLTKQKEAEIKKLSYDSRILSANAFQTGGLGGHFGGSFSSAEILNVLYHSILKVDPKNPNWEGRDHFILSKGHAAAMYASVLALRGFFDPEEIMSYDKLDSPFGMHTTLYVPGIEFAAGSLGHGLSFGVGLALGKKKAKNNTKVYVLMGDGELDGGPVWEAAMAAGKYQLDNLVAIVDRNRCNMEGDTEDIMPLEPLEDKWRSFGWGVKTVDGHNVKELHDTFTATPFEPKKPSFVIARTIKGKGDPSMEGNYKFHYVKIADDKYEKCIQSLENAKKECTEGGGN
jgi:transketolase